MQITQPTLKQPCAKIIKFIGVHEWSDGLVTHGPNVLNLVI